MKKKIVGIFVCTLLMIVTVLPALGIVNSENTLTKNTVLYNDPPEADAGGPYNAEEGTEVIFDASGSHDPDGDLLWYCWDFDGDEVWDTEWLHEPLIEFSYGDDYDGYVNLAVSDGELTDFDHSSVLINNVAPTVDAGLDQIVCVGETVYYNGFFNDLGFLDNHVFSWAFGGLCADKEKLNATVSLISVKFSQFVHEWKCSITTNGERIFDLHFFLMVGDMSDSFQNGKEGIPKGFPRPPDSNVKIHPNGYSMNVTFNDGLPDNYQFSIYTKVKDIDDNVGIQWTTTKSGGEETNTGSMGKPNSPIGPFEKIYDEPGFYNSILTVYDDDGDYSTDYMSVQVVESLPPISPSITGQTSGKPGTEYEYTFNAVDPDGDNVKYHIDWGDTNSDTTAFSSSGTDVKVKHTWSTGGTYTITATAEDSYGAVGPEGTLTVTMPRNKLYFNTPFLNFLEQYPILYQLLLRFLRL